MENSSTLMLKATWYVEIEQTWPFALEQTQIIAQVMVAIL